MQVCLGRMYEADPAFAAHYDGIRAGLATWFRRIVDASARAHGIDPDTAAWQESAGPEACTRGGVRRLHSTTATNHANQPSEASHRSADRNQPHDRVLPNPGARCR
jgi:hypothetical protein